MILWWRAHPDRLQEEIDALESLEKEASWLRDLSWELTDTFQLCVRFTLHIENRNIALELVYYNSFPYSPPSVFPMEKKLLSIHQYGPAGELCLEYRNDNWRSVCSGADMIKSAHKLFCLETPDESGRVTPAASSHVLTERMRLRSARLRLYISNECYEFLINNLSDVSNFEIVDAYYSSSCSLKYVHSVSLNDGKKFIMDLPEALQNSIFKKTVPVVSTNISAQQVQNLSDPNELDKTLIGLEKVQERNNGLVIITSDKSVFLYKKDTSGENCLIYKAVISPQEDIHRSGNEYQIYQKKSVAIIGLGSIGSKIASCLARSGVSNFVLVDSDILFEQNLQRHDSDWRSVGLHKVDAADERIKMILPKASVAVFRADIVGDVSGKEANIINEELSKCDIIIDCTANPLAFNHLTSLAILSGKTLLWGGVYSGGIGGYIARSRPDIDVDPNSIRAGIHEFCSGQDEPPKEVSGVSYSGFENQKVLIASDAEVSVISSHLANFALDSMLDANDSKYTSSVYLIGMKPNWIFRGAFDVQPLNIEGTKRKNLSIDEKSPHADFIISLLKKKHNEHQNSEENN